LQLLLVLLHPSSQFDSSVPGPRHVESPGVRVVLHEFLQLALLQAHGDEMLGFARFEDYLRFKIVKNLVVTEVRVCREDEKFVVRADSFERQNNYALLDHVKLREVITILDNVVAGQVNPGVEV
jgi:hypothetical protein